MRKLKEGETVWIYLNLNATRKRKRRIYSVLGSDGRLAAHVEQALLWNVRFIVRQAGRKRVIREARKNVHAFVKGAWSSNPDRPILRGILVTYDPRKNDTFVAGKSPVFIAKVARLARDGLHARFD